MVLTSSNLFWDLHPLSLGPHLGRRSRRKREISLYLCATLAKGGGAEGDVQMRRRNALSAPSVVQRMIVADCKVLSGLSLSHALFQAGTYIYDVHCYWGEQI